MRVALPLLLLLAAALQAQPALRIGTITIHNLDIYSPEESGRGAFYRAADALHVETRRKVIERFLLFHEGEPFRPERLEETERNLRALRFLKSASVIASPPHDGVVDVIVTTQDSWSIAPETDAGSKGGANTYGVQLSESNLLGYGKEIVVGWDKGIDRTSASIDYRDPSFFAPYWNALLTYGRNSDGYRHRAIFRRPFFSFATPWAAELSFQSYKQDDRLYAGGVTAEKFVQRHREIILSYGRALDPNDEEANRVTAGVRSLDDDFVASCSLCRAKSRHLRRRSNPECPEHSSSPTQSDCSDDPSTSLGINSSVLPATREFRFLFARFSHAENRYLKLNFVNKDLRYEDFNLGQQYSIEGGFSPRAFGTRANTTFLRGTAAQGITLGPESFVMPSILAESRFDGGAQNAYVSSLVTYVRRSNGNHPRALVGRIALNQGWRLDREVQFVADGLTGLRGYRVHSFAGDKSLIVNLEQRVYIGRELLQLLSPGVVAFVDSGNATSGGFGRLLNLKTDVGIGIRIGLPRTPKNLLRLDLAYPLNRDALGKRGLLVSISSGQAF